MHKGLLEDIEFELKNAEQARLAGNEGWAAGIAVRDFLTRHGVPAHRSAYTALQALAAFPGLAPDLRSAAVHLTMRVTDDFTLPAEADLIAEARKLIGGLG